MTLQPGSVIRLSSFTDRRKTQHGEVELGFKVQKRGQRFVALLLGVEQPGQPMDPEEALKALGWTPPKE